MNEPLNYEAELMAPKEVKHIPAQFQFHAENLSFAYDHISHVMRHHGASEMRFRKLQTQTWRTVKI